MGKLTLFVLFSVSLENKFCLFQGSKLWIIMEYLGGGSALDLVSVKEVSSQIYWWNSTTLNENKASHDMKSLYHTPKSFSKTRAVLFASEVQNVFKMECKVCFLWYSTGLRIRRCSRLCNFFMCWVLSWIKLNGVCFSLWRVSECFISVSSLYFLCVCVCAAAGGSVRWGSDCHHAEGDPEGARLPALWEEDPQRH